MLIITQLIRKRESGERELPIAQEFVDKLRNELIDRGIAPKIIVRILLNIDETGIVYKSVPKRTYKFIGTPFMATSYTFGDGNYNFTFTFHCQVK